MKKLFTSLFLLSGILCLQAQNLVPKPQFEILTPTTAVIQDFYD